MACLIYVLMFHMTRKDCRSTQSQNHSTAKPGGEEELAELLRKQALPPLALVQIISYSIFIKRTSAAGENAAMTSSTEVNKPINQNDKNRRREAGNPDFIDPSSTAHTELITSTCQQ
ncbi:uncharacterized protein AAES06_001342 [Glossophaga mutica]